MSICRQYLIQHIIITTETVARNWSTEAEKAKSWPSRPKREREKQFIYKKQEQ